MVLYPLELTVLQQVYHGGTETRFPILYRIYNKTVSPCLRGKTWDLHQTQFRKLL